MRQAGRYLPEYRKLRAEAGDILNLFRNPELACEAAMQPLARYPLDAAILFSDILTVPDAMGLGLHFVAGEGPCFRNPVRRTADIDRLPLPDPTADLAYVMDAVVRTRRALRGTVPLIGFAGSPWTLACYMVEGRGGTDFGRILGLAREQPQLLKRLLHRLAAAVALYLDAQVDAGAEVVQIFDSWGGILPQLDDYRRWSLQWIEQALDGVRRTERGRHVPRIVFVKDRGRALELLAGCADAIGVDSEIDIGEAGDRVDGRAAVQGNLDPLLLCGAAEPALAETRRILDAWGDRAGLVFNLGHGIPPQADPQLVGQVVAECLARGDREPA